jgi:ribonuclease P protein subunit POP4
MRLKSSHVRIKSKVQKPCHPLNQAHLTFVIVIPKQNSIFTFAVPLYSTLPAIHKPDMPFPLPSVASGSAPMKTVLDGPYMEFELYGNQFRFRSADRAGRKFKHKETIEL